jgi:hypothetical protein
VKKNGAFWEVRSSAGIVQFRSLRRVNCVGWVKENTPKTEE